MGGSGGGSGGSSGGGGFRPTSVSFTGGSDPCFAKRIVVLDDVLAVLPKPRPGINVNDIVDLVDNSGVLEAAWNGIHIGNIPIVVAGTLRLCLANGVSYSSTIYSFDPNMPRIEIALVRL